MKIKDHRRFTRWEFYLGEEDKYRIPREGHSGSREKLVKEVKEIMQSLEMQQVGNFWSKVKEEAEKYGAEVDQYLGLLIEHQICVRLKQLGKDSLCWSSGLGDTVHKYIGKAEDLLLSKSPGPLKKAYTGAVKKLLPGSGGRTRKCGACGGSSSFSTKQKSNLGRVGILNKMGGKKNG